LCYYMDPLIPQRCTCADKW